MSTSALKPGDDATRFDVPADDKILRRQALARIVHGVRSRPLTLLVGPPGSGKTQLLLQVMATIDAGKGTILHYFDAAGRSSADLRTWLADILARLPSLPQQSDDGLDHPSALSANVHDREAAANSVFGFIDNYESFDSEQSGRLILDFAGISAGFCHLLISGRQKSHLDISELCAKRAAAILGPGDLFFSDEEIEEYFDFRLGEPQLGHISASTRGWPITLKAVRPERAGAGVSEPSERALVIHGGEIIEFVAEQIYRPLSENLRDFLRDTSLLDRIDPAVANWIRERADSGLLLQELAQAIPGLVGRDDSSTLEAYILHPYLKEHARSCLDADLPRRDQMYERAISWFEARLEHSSAISLARQSQVADALENLLDRLNGWEIFCNSGVSEMYAILRNLTSAEVDARPCVKLLEVLAHFKSGFYVEASRKLQVIKRTTCGFTLDPKGKLGALRSQGAILETVFSMNRDGVNFEDCLFDRAMDVVGDDDLLGLSLLEFSRFAVAEMRGHLAGALEGLKRCEAIYERLPQAHYTGHFLPLHRAIVALARGAFKEAHDILCEQVKAHRHLPFDELSGTAIAKVIAASLAYEKRFVDEAGVQAREAIELLGPGNHWFTFCAIAYPMMFATAHRAGGAKDVRDLAQEIRQRVSRLKIADLTALVDTLEVNWLIRDGKLEDLEPSIQTIQSSLDGPQLIPWRLFDAQAAVLAKWFIATNKPGDAMTYAERLTEAGRRGGRMRTLAKGKFLRVLILDALGENSAASEELHAVLNTAAGEHMVAIFAEEGDCAARLISEIAADRNSAPVVRRHARAIMRIIPLAAGETTDLNERETEIALHLRGGLSNKMIARKLGVTENTIKFHLKKIFYKLGVTGRGAAAAAFERHQLAAAAEV